MTATNSDNIISHISRAYVEERISKKDNRPYSVLTIEWIMSNEKIYKQSVFLSSEQLSLIESSVAKEALLQLQGFCILILVLALKSKLNVKIKAARVAIVAGW